MNQQMSAVLASSMKAGGLGSIKPGEFKIIAASPAKKDDRQPRVLKGKAMLTVDAVLDINGERAYDVSTALQTCSGNFSDDAYLELSNHTREGGYPTPNQCKRMGIGDRWRIAVVYIVTYTPTFDHEGNKDWEVIVELPKAKTRFKSPWNDKRHRRYVSKSKRSVEQVAVSA